MPEFIRRAFARRSGEFDHRKLYRVLQDGIRRGLLPPGARLLASRRLAQGLGIARNTVVHVYAQLALEGHVQAGVGRGTFVAQAPPRLAGTKGPRQAKSAAAAEPSTLMSRRGIRVVERASAGTLQWGAFTPGVPEVRMFPAQIWSRLQSRLWRSVTPPQLSYAIGAGDPGLRYAIAEYLRNTRGVRCTPEQVVVTSGTQQSLHLVAQLLTDAGDSLWLEEPGYWGARSVFEALGTEAGAGAAGRRRPGAEPATAARAAARDVRFARRTSTPPAS